MLLTSACFISLLATSLSVPVKRSDVGDKLLEALGNGVATGVGGALSAGATTAVDALVHEATGLLSKGLTSIVGSLFGKRDLVGDLVQTGEKEILKLLEGEFEKLLGKRSDVGDKLLEALGNGVATGVGGALSAGATTAVDALVHEATGLLSKGLTSIVGSIFGKRDLVGDLVQTGEKEILKLLEGEFEKLLGKRSDVGDKLLEALGNGVATGVGGALSAGATTAVDALVHEATGLLSKGLTSIVGSIFGKRDLAGDLVQMGEKEILKLLEGEFEKILANIHARRSLESIGEEIFKLLAPAVEKEVEQLLGNLKLKRSKVGDELLAALTPQLTQAAGSITAAALQPITAELSSALSALTSTAVKGITSGIASLFGR